MEINALKSIVSISGITFLIVFSYKIGIYSRIKSSAFYEKNDKKEELLKEAKENLMKPDEGIFIALLHSMPLTIFTVLMYFVTFLLIHKEIIGQNYEFSLVVIILAPCLFMIERSELLYSYHLDRQIIGEDAKIHYERPTYVVLIIMLVYIAISYFDQNIAIDKKIEILESLGILSIKENATITYFYYITFFTHIVIIKPFTRYLMGVERHYLFTKMIEEGKKSKDFYQLKNRVSIVSTVAWIFTVIVSLLLLALIVISEVKVISLGAIIVIACISSIFATLSGQRAEFLTAYSKAYIKQGTIYYKSIDGKYFEWIAKG